MSRSNRLFGLGFLVLLGWSAPAQPQSSSSTVPQHGKYSEPATAGEGACRIDIGVTPDDFGSAHACPDGGAIDTQYVDTHYILFGTAANPSAASVSALDDTACAPPCRMAANPPFATDWWCGFAVGAGPGVPGAPAEVTTFSADVCFVDNAMTMQAYDRDMQLIDTAATSVFGASRLSVTAPVGTAIAFVRIAASQDFQGVSIDCLDYPDPFPDADEDHVPDAEDNCPTVSNPDQANVDGDALGDACDNDNDNDTVPDSQDNCRRTANPNQADADADTVGDACDNCVDAPNSDQADLDGDGLGAACDPCDSAPPSARTWALPDGNNWENASHWSPADVPDSPEESAIIDSPTPLNPIVLDASVTLDRVSIFDEGASLHLHNETLEVLSCDGLYNRGSVVVPFGLSRLTGRIFNEPAGLLQVRPSSIMELGGPTITNHGEFLMGSSVSALCVLRVVANTEIAGSGFLNMSDGSAQLETTGGAVFTNGPGHLLRGRGEIRALMHNDGTIRADFAPNAVLALVTNNKSNLGTISAANDAILDINAITIENAGGWLRSYGGTVRLQSNAHIIGGTFDSTSGYEVRSQNATLTNIENQGTLRIASNTTALMTGSWLQNEGLIALGGGSSSLVVMRFDDQIAIQGGGRIEMLDGSSQVGTNPGIRISQTWPHLIRGRGEIRAALYNAGTIHADYGQDSPLELIQEPKTNTHIMQATNAAILSINGIPLDNTGGRIIALGALVRIINNAHVTGGTFETDTGEVRTQNATLTDIENLGLLRIASNTTTSVTGSEFVNDATIAMGTGASSLVVMRFDSPVDLTGLGSIEMLDGSSQVNSGGAGRLMHHDTHLIRGRGEIRAAMDNDGLIRSDFGPAALLELNGENKNNTGTISATNGAILEIDTITLDNTGGVLLADGGDVRFVGDARIIGGVFQTTGDSEIRSQGATLTDIVNTGLLRIVDNSTTAVDGTELRNDNVIAFGAGFSSLVIMRFDSNVQIVGTGRIDMLSGSAQLNTGVGAVLTIGPQQSVHGRGSISAEMTNLGVIVADHSAGQPLALNGNPKTHLGSMQATNAAILQVSADVDGSGDWLADGGTIRVRDFAVVRTAGPIRVENDGLLDVQSGEMGGSNLTIENGGRLSVASRVRLSGNLDFATQNEADWNWSLGSSLIMARSEGCRYGFATLEVGGRDNGAGGTGVGNFGIRDLALTDGAAVALVDLADNGNRGSSEEPEALYATSLTLGAGALLNLNGLRFYVNGALIVPGPVGFGVVIDGPLGTVAGGAVDIGTFTLCMRGPGVTVTEDCSPSDLDCDGDVDLRDYRILLTDPEP